MVKSQEPKEFQVLDPARDPDEALVDEEQNIFGRWRGRLTFTGTIWLFVPWYLLLRKRLNYSLLEFWLVMLAWGISAGVMAAGMREQKFPAWVSVVVEYFIFHSHCLAFTAALYNLKRWQKFDLQFRPKRWPMIISYSTVATLVWLLLGIAFSQ